MKQLPPTDGRVHIDRASLQLALQETLVGGPSHMPQCAMVTPRAYFDHKEPTSLIENQKH